MPWAGLIGSMSMTPVASMTPTTSSETWRKQITGSVRSQRARLFQRKSCSRSPVRRCPRRTQGRRLVPSHRCRRIPPCQAAGLRSHSGKIGRERGISSILRFPAHPFRGRRARDRRSDCGGARETNCRAPASYTVSVYAEPRMCRYQLLDALAPSKWPFRTMPGSWRASGCRSDTIRTAIPVNSSGAASCARS